MKVIITLSDIIGLITFALVIIFCLCLYIKEYIKDKVEKKKKTKEDNLC